MERFFEIVEVSDNSWRIVLDTVFKGKLSLVSSIPAPPLHTYVSVEYDPENEMNVLGFIESGSEEGERVPFSPRREPVKPTGILCKLEGTLQEVSIGDSNLGSLTIGLPELALSMIIGRSFVGTIPNIGEHVIVEYEDCKVPRVSSIEPSHGQRLTEPVCTPIPENHW